MNAFQDFVLTMSQLPPMPPMCLIFLWARRSSHSVTWLCKELLTMLIMVNLVVIFVGVPANRRSERIRCKSAEVATPARRLLFASPAQARQESRCSDTAASSFAWVGGWGWGRWGWVVEAYRCQPGLKRCSKLIPWLRKVEEDVCAGEQHGKAGHNGEEAGRQGAPPDQQNSNAWLKLWYSAHCLSHICCCLEGLGGPSPRSEICSVPILKLCLSQLSSPTLHKHSNILLLTFHLSCLYSMFSCQLKVLLWESKTTLNLLCWGRDLSEIET